MYIFSTQSKFLSFLSSNFYCRRKCNYSYKKKINCLLIINFYCKIIVYCLLLITLFIYCTLLYGFNELLEMNQFHNIQMIIKVNSTGASDGRFYLIFNKKFDHLETLPTIHRPKQVLSTGA